MKMAPVILETQRRGLDHLFVHTGQHYDAAMSSVFFDELGMPQPDVYLGVGSGTHAQQTARMMTAFEPVCLERRPKLVIVAGDVNSTLACALVAAKLSLPVAHIEAGLRSFDRSMPEEINRVLTDHISELLFTSEPGGTKNLLREGVDSRKIHFVGNCMIDSLRSHLEAARARTPWAQFNVHPKAYGLVTLHRPSTVDDPETLDEIRRALKEVGRIIPLLFPVHPRTQKQIVSLGQDWAPVRFIEPLGYLDFLGLMAEARLVLTDSGGIQEETTALGVPCITMRNNTERPVTIEVGTNRIAGTAGEKIISACRDALTLGSRGYQIPELWDGHASQRVIDVIQKWLR